MLALLKLNRLNKLMAQYTSLKNEALQLMQSGDLHNYILKLEQASKVRNMYMNTAKMRV
ncbi:MAG: hypothetical protein SFW35_02685 [Chitinophagales bacterium]|nr:hypothetical protein [Chitinophagales bacterium]